MESKKNIEVVLTFVDEFKNKGNHDIVDEIFTEDFVHHLKLPGISSTRDGTKQIGKLIVGAFPDVNVTVEDTLVDGNKVVERSLAKATHKGEFLGIPATNKTVFWTETHIYRINNGKIAEHWPQLDMFGLMAQIRGD